MRDEGRTDQSLIVSIPNISGKFVSYKIISIVIFRDLRNLVLSVYSFLAPLKIQGKKLGPLQEVFFQIKIFIPEVVGYKTSLFNKLTPRWLIIRSNSDFVSGLITSAPCSSKVHSYSDDLIINFRNNRRR